MRTLTFGTNYYFMRNVKGVAELNIDLLKKKDHLAGSPFVGHLSSEHSFLVGLDVAF
jgi:hypothetical protein